VGVYELDSLLIERSPSIKIAIVKIPLVNW